MLLAVQFKAAEDRRERKKEQQGLLGVVANSRHVQSVSGRRVDGRRVVLSA